jgi:hypothetical protein
MIDLDRNLDLDASGNLTTIEGTTALAQRLENTLGTQRGEWRYSLNHGVPWLFQFLGESGDSAAMRQLLVQQIAADSEVSSVGEFTVAFDGETRQLQYKIPVRAITGETAIVQS